MLPQVAGARDAAGSTSQSKDHRRRSLALLPEGTNRRLRLTRSCSAPRQGCSTLSTIPTTAHVGVFAGQEAEGRKSRGPV